MKHQLEAALLSYTANLACNAQDCFAKHFSVAIVKAETIIGHVPHKSLLATFQLLFQYH